MTSTAFMQAFDGADAKAPTTITGLTASATAGTRNTVTHGLAYTPKVVIAVQSAADADGAQTTTNGSIAIVSISSTAIVTRANIASQAYSLVCFP